MSKVSIVRCNNYNSREVIDAVFYAVDLLGGIKNFIKQNDNVLIKPNLLSPRRPDEAVCTHPEVLRAAIKLVKEARAKPIVGDSPGSFFTVRDVDFVYEATEVKRITEEENAELIKFEKSCIINGYPIAEVCLNASLIISLPKLKTHALTIMTGAIKNTFGLIPGLSKVECHRNNPKPKDFVKILLDIFEITKPRLSIMDAIVAMEGDGPAAGDPRALGLILASPDAVSLDVVISELVGLPPHRDIVISEARRRGAGETNINNIRILGTAIEDIKLSDFKLPKTSYRINLVPDFLANIFTRAIDFKPVINEDLCKKCKVCKNNCPVDAITITEQCSQINNRICVRCFCCHEVCCYSAIYIKRNFIANLLWRD
jgi:uncharacterized protein (DUF362 family)/NAD-dependent dihydropyrimidine dehydrogenase PreA subunit